MKRLFVSCLVAISICSYAQNLSSISGNVIDAKTKEILPGASVYLAQTTFGISANADGTFVLSKIPSGKYDFTVSMLGYKLYSKRMLFTGTSKSDLLIEMELEAVQLNTVEIKDRKLKIKRKDYSDFKQFFLGQTRNANKCEILNKKDIIAYKEDNKLIAFTKKPIEIENQALGYKIYYNLQEFKLDYKHSHLIFSGVPRFEEIKPSSQNQLSNWIKERDRAYYGSVAHFLLSLRRLQLKENLFHLTGSSGVELFEKDLLRDSLILYKGNINVTFDGESPEQYSRGSQISIVKLIGNPFINPIIIYENGYFEDFHDILFQGYFGWSSGIAELLPLGYRPTEPLSK